MSVPAYTFKVTLIGSQNPVIFRTFTIPASWTFYRLHAAIQYTIGWENCHLHQWSFEPARKPRPRAERGCISLAPRETLMVIHMGAPEDEDEDQWWEPAGLRIGEKDIRLCDIWEDTGKYRRSATKDGRLGTCYYLYDFGDNWDHQVTFMSKTTLDSKKLKVLEVKGAGPLEDAGGVLGWDGVKRAFTSTDVSEASYEKKMWAREISGLGQAYDPNVAPTIDELNAPGGYKGWLLKAAEGSGDYDDPDDEEEEESNRGFKLDINSLLRMPMLESFSNDFGPRINCTPEARRFVTHEGTHPLDLFPPTINACTVRAPRFVHTDNTHMASILIFIDGAAINENTPNVRAGYGIHLDPASTGIACPLENVEGQVRTANRAELRAAVLALQMRFWPGEGFRRIVIGADSEYLVRGACEWSVTWRQRGWKTSRGEAVKNRDLWEMLFSEIERWERMGIRVQFYLLKKEWNAEADRCARQGAEVTDIPTQLQEMVYISSPLAGLQ